MEFYGIFERPPENTCPKEKCGQPPRSTRWKAGEKNWVCGNGHNYTLKDLADKAKRDQAKEAETKELVK